MTSSGLTDGTTATAVTSSSSSRSSATSVGEGATLDTVTILTIVIGISGAVANGFVFCGVICSSSSSRRNATNVFICNQIVLDFIACFSLTFSTLMDASSSIDGVAGWVLCLLFASNTLLVVPMYASQAGLVIITVERYAKIVHPVAHRKHFQSWMIKAGVIAPWLVGVVTYLIPNWSTTRFVNGTCLSFGFWPTKQMFVAYSGLMIIFMLVIPLAIFAFCYGSIFGVIQRQSRQVSGAATAAPPAAGGAEVSKPASRSQRKVIRTMLSVCASYMICWFPIKFYILASVAGWVVPIGDIFIALMLFSYVNMLVNPMIYVTHFRIVGHIQQTVFNCFNRRDPVALGSGSDGSNDNSAPTPAATGASR